MKGYIYKFENLINGKCYIGQSFQAEKRIQQHWYCADDDKCTLPLYRGIRKYGKENFKADIILIIHSMEKEELEILLNEAEINLIKQFNSKSPGGYNIKGGGAQGGRGNKHSIETKIKLSKKTKQLWKDGVFDNRPEYSEEAKWMMGSSFRGKKRSIENCQKISKALKNRKFTDDWRRKISENRKGLLSGEENPAAVKVKNIDTGKIFNTVREAAKFYNIKSRCNISSVCTGKLKTCGGYKWAYA